MFSAEKKFILDCQPVSGSIKMGYVVNLKVFPNVPTKGCKLKFGEPYPVLIILSWIESIAIWILITTAAFYKKAW